MIQPDPNPHAAGDTTQPDSPTTQVSQPHVPTAPQPPASVPYGAFKERLGKRDARISALETELVDLTTTKEEALAKLSDAAPDAEAWRSYRTARLDMLKDQVPTYLANALEGQTLADAETTVAAFLDDNSTHKPGSDNRRPTAGGNATRMKPLSQMTSNEHRETHESRLSQYR